MPPLRVSAAHARRFHRRAVLLDAPAPGVPEALAHLGYVQIDPINVCGRMHDLILRNRVAGYREGDLTRHLHGDGAPLAPERRAAFEHFLPYPGVLAAFPCDAWPWLKRAMRARTARVDAWSGRLTREEARLGEALLREVARRGPSGPEDFDDGRKARAAWGPATLAKHTMQKLFFHGRLLVAARGAGQRRVYDLPERVLPAHALAAPEPGEDDALRWEALLRLRQRRLVALKRAELARVEDAVQAVAVDGATLHCLRDDLPLFDATAAEPDARAAPLLLAPLDPLVYDRRVTASLWGFDYTWEVYTPPAKRRRGYYALPVLAGAELVGHVDPKADRAGGKLAVVGRSVRRGHAVAGAVAELARFLGLRK
ncbi:MAG: crosslink repair DNA glycosylase YcaQ family protein [Polyangiales bacterium]